MATIAVHGGAGGGDEPQVEGVRAALDAGLEAFASGTALDAVCAAVATLEADGRFNAGRGAVRTLDGGVELDAAVMTGHDHRAGAVAAMTSVQHPVLVARALLESGDAVFLVGRGAKAFAREIGMGPTPTDWFTRQPVSSPLGTVGAVAVDDQGRCAAATSTGGVAGQRAGRVGDSPVIGSGTFADHGCAVSATGDGEVFIRTVFAHSIARAVASGAALAEACATALREVGLLQGGGGCVAITAAGDVAIDHNTKVMPAGFASTKGAFHVQLSKHAGE